MSVNQNIKPITAERGGNGDNLYIGGCDLTELAEKYGTPLYVIDEESLRQICREHREAFKDYPNIKMTYASKALCNLTITKIVESEGFGFDVVSAGELFTVHKAGVNMRNVTFNGNNKTQREIELALDYKVGRFSVDNFYEAELLNKICEEKNEKVGILLRITPGIECHTHDYIQTGQIDCKFGFDLTELDEIVDLIKNKYKNLNLKGLHAHIGSQIFEPKSFEDEIDILVNELVAVNRKHNLNLSELNIGGGLGVKYVESDCPPAVSEIAEVIIKSMHTASEKYGIELPTIYIEPGRSIISTAGVTLYTVGSMKQVPNGRKYAAVDGGMADNPRPSLYQAKYTAEIANDTEGRKNEKVTIAGRYCESGDILIENITLPEPKAGDILCIYNTGAYNYSMASNYNNNPIPGVVLVRDGKSAWMVKPQTYEQILQNNVVPDFI